MPDYRNTYEPISRDAAHSANIDADVFVALIERESEFNPHAVSKDGSVGIAQLQPQFHAVDATDPVASLNYAAQLIASYRDLFGGRYDLALAAYNVGSPTIASLGRVPINGRTEFFVTGILSRSIELRTICGQESTPPIFDESEASALDTLSLALGLIIGSIDR